jgi:hypothetical protein
MRTPSENYSNLGSLSFGESWSECNKIGGNIIDDSNELKQF